MGVGIILQIVRLRFVLTPCLYGVAPGQIAFPKMEWFPCQLHARRKLTGIRLLIPCRWVRFDAHEGVGGFLAVELGISRSELTIEERP